MCLWGGGGADISDKLHHVILLNLTPPKHPWERLVPDEPKGSQKHCAERSVPCLRQVPWFAERLVERNSNVQPARGTIRGHAQTNYVLILIPLKLIYSQLQSVWPRRLERGRENMESFFGQSPVGSDLLPYPVTVCLAAYFLASIHPGALTAITKFSAVRTVE